MNDKVFTMRFSPEVYRILEELARNLNIRIEDVIAKSLAFMQMAQGRTVTLKNRQGSFDVHDFSNLPSSVKIEKK